MTWFRHHPIPVLAGLLVVAFTLFALSGVPRFRDATAGTDLVAGNIFWFGFLAFSLAFLVGCVTVVVGQRSHRRESV